MPDFTVDVGGLAALGKNLDRTNDNIDSATKKLADLGPDSIGSDELDRACADFRDDWKEGLELIREAVDEIRDGLDQATEGYRDLENKIRENLQQMAKAIEESAIAC